jgi:O-antigen/teichoic acid export membrane protein
MQDPPANEGGTESLLGTDTLREALKTAGANAGKYLPVRFVPALTSLITVPVFTRMIGAEEYGYFYLVVAATALMAHVSITWITQSVIRYYWEYEKRGELSECVATAVWSSVGSLLLVSATVALVVWALSDHISAGLLDLVPVGLFAFVTNRVVTALLEVFKAAGDASHYAVYSVTSTLVGTALAVYLVVVAEWGAAGILVGNGVGFLVVIPPGVRALGRKTSLAPRGVHLSTLGKYVSYGVPMAMASLSYWVLVLSDRYVIGLMRGSAEAGLYSVAYGLGEKLMQLITLPLAMTMVPMLVRVFEKQGEEMAVRVQSQFTRYYALLTFPLLFGLAVVARDFMTVFTAEEYRVAFPVLPIVAIGTLLYGLSELGACGVIVRKRSRIVMENTVVTAVSNLAANLVLVPRLGYVAAAYTTVGAYALLLTLTWVRTRPHMPWDVPWLDVGRVTLAAGGMAAAVWALSASLTSSVWVLLLLAVVGVVVYTLLARLFGAVRAEEMAFVREAGVAAVRKVRRRA